MHIRRYANLNFNMGRKTALKSFLRATRRNIEVLITPPVHIYLMASAANTSGPATSLGDRKQSRQNQDLTVVSTMRGQYQSTSSNRASRQEASCDSFQGHTDERPQFTPLISLRNLAMAVGGICLGWDEHADQPM
ncbi:hypothetical protein F25303_4382 [Fusarium sp. NRRL 25303]|nr:hypothetical protein F25303_4382 [Fusarium sp. NRRL 25303]